MSAKAVVGVIIVAILVGVLYVVLEKNFIAGSLSDSQTSSSKEVPKGTVTSQAPEESSLIKYPEPAGASATIDSSTDLFQTAEGLEMRDYSGMFEELKETVSAQ